MISVTDAAVQKIKTLITENEKELDGLRMAVKGGGCSGFQYDLEFADRSDELDHVFETKGVKIFIDMKSSLYLNGVTLDYQDGLMGSGFKIENPNARTTCGCGESFSA
jgi:iron-sulfur cluster assembly protein